MPTPADYTIPNYIAAINAMFTQLGVALRLDRYLNGRPDRHVVMAATPGSRMRRFVINDIGPVIEGRARPDRVLRRQVPTFPSYMALFEAVQPINATFGPLTDEQKHHMVKTAVQQRPDGQWDSRLTRRSGRLPGRTQADGDGHGHCGPPSRSRCWCCAVPSQICSVQALSTKCLRCIMARVGLPKH